MAAPFWFIRRLVTHRDIGTGEVREYHIPDSELPERVYATGSVSSRVIGDYQVLDRHVATGALRATKLDGNTSYFADVGPIPDVASIPGYSPVLVKDEDGLIDILTLEGLWNRINSPTIRAGDHEIKKVEGLLTLTSQGWEKIEHISRHPYQGSLVRIEARCGLVDATPNHSIILKGWNHPYNAGELKPGMKISPLSHNTFKHYRGRGKGCREGFFIGSKDLAWLFGFFTADGSATYERNSGKYMLQFVNKDETLLERAEKIIIENLNEEPAWVEDKTPHGDDISRFTVHNKYLYRWFKERFYTGDGFKRVPKEILNAPDSIVEAFINGYLDGDGSRKKFERFDFTTNSQILAAGLTYLINSRLGRSYSHRYRPEKKCYEIYVNKGGWERDVAIDEKGRFIHARGVRKDPSEIKSVHRIPYSGYVYDLEVKPRHLFNTGIGFITVHNTEYAYGKTLVGDPKFYSVTPTTAGVAGYVMIDAISRTSITLVASVSGVTARVSVWA